MPLGGPRFGPRGLGGPGHMQNPRFKQFPPHMQPRMHYGPRQSAKPRPPMSNNFNQNKPQNMQPAKMDVPPVNKPVEVQPTKPVNQDLNAKAPNVPLKPDMKIEPTTPKPVAPKISSPSGSSIKVVTSTNAEEKSKPQLIDVVTKQKSTQPQQVNTNGNYMGQQRDNHYSNQRDNQYSNQRDNQYSNQRDNQYSNQQRDNQYSNKQRDSHPYLNVTDSRSNDQGGRMWQQGRQDYNKMGDKQNLMNKPYYSNDRVRDKVRMIAGPQIDLPPLDMSEKKFNSYSRLFVGNLQKNITSDDLHIVFSKYGEIGQTYVNKEASYAFINFDFKANALKAMKELDNTMIKGRAIKVRIAAISDGIRVKNLGPTVSNELLEKAFSVFGNVESCKVIVDDRGLPTGEGTVVFKDKKTAFLAVKKCQEECFILTSTSRPVVVNPIEQSDTNEEGLPEASLQKNEEYMRERAAGPHFADETSFEFELGEEWKKIYQVHEDRKKALEAEFLYDKERIEKKLILARVEYEKEKLRKELAAREAESAHLRRHFESEALAPSKTYSEANDVLQYETYGSSKRPADTPYDSAYAGSYDAAYKESYDRPYGRDYDRGYGRDYDRAGYGGYSRDGGAYDRGYEVSSADPIRDIPERAKYEAHDPHFDIAEPYAAFDRAAAQDAYQANKRPRY